jgi:peroxiredoxin
MQRATGLLFLWLLATVHGRPALRAAESQTELLPGHSMHGEAFDEGPRQKAYLMKGTGKVGFPITTKNAEAQAFFDQGVGQLHGFWYFEAERSFRQVLALDTNCATAYWGMAMANVNTTKRAKEFIKKAAANKQNVSSREQAYIDAWAEFYKDDKRGSTDKRKDLVKALEQVVKEFPDDLEAKAFLALQIWENSSKGVALKDRQPVEDLIRQITAVEPMHPAHHYRIHLWNTGNYDTNSLISAALCGQASPTIAHMWHMSGHTFFALKRYADAAWQQEASARADHAYMIHDHVLPDQIHNFAHNNEWLIRDLNHIGRVRDAVDLAKNMIELPRHPKYNTLTKGSASYGRMRLFETLIRYELWDELIADCNSVYLEPTDTTNEQIKRVRALGTAWFHKGNASELDKQIAALERLAPKGAEKSTPGTKKASPSKAGAKKPDPANDEKKEEVSAKAQASGSDLAAKDEKPAEKQKEGTYSDPESSESKPAPATGGASLTRSALAELKAYRALLKSDMDTARKEYDAAKDLPKERQAQFYLRLDDKTKAQQLALDAVKGATNQVQIFANYVDILNHSGKSNEAFTAFAKLRSMAAYADLEAPVFQRLRPVADALKLGKDWRMPPPKSMDVGVRPALDTIGPFRWQPQPAPDWTLTDSSGKKISLKQYRGKPVVMIFYLGYGCAHCIEQLNAFAPVAKDFKVAGLSLVAVSTDSVEGLSRTLERAKRTEPFPFPLVSDQELKVFKTWRAFDDFENTPLHGTFLVDGDGLVRWQDISYEPFKETKFLLGEAKRLLAQPKGNGKSLRLAENQVK